MAEPKNKTEEPAKLTLQQKFVKLREAIPALTQKAYSDGVKYKFIKISDIYEHLTPAMNALNINLEIIEESATRHYENGDEMYYTNYTQNTKNGVRTVWVYEADLTLQWINADNPEETQELTLHALGTNDSGPDKAKGSAWTYAIKYYFFEKFGIDQSEEDPDMKDLSDGTLRPQNQNVTAQKGAGGKTTPPNNKNVGNVQKSLSDKQMERMYRKGKDAELTKEQINEWILKKYGQNEPQNMTREQYDETCAALDAAKKKEEEQNNA